MGSVVHIISPRLSRRMVVGASPFCHRRICKSSFGTTTTSTTTSASNSAFDSDVSSRSNSSAASSNSPGNGNGNGNGNDWSDAERMEHGRLRGKVALITGAGSGIGRQAAFLFAHEGATVAVADWNISAAARTADAVREFGGKGTAVAVDVAVASEVQAMVEKVEKKYGGLHILFNNAGIMDGDDDDVTNTPDEVIDRTFDVNVKGVMFGCRYGIPAIKRSGGGSVVNTASFVALMGAATPQVAYTASKGAVLALTRELAVIHARGRVRVNALCPGPLRTELLMKFLDTEEKKQRRLVHIPMGRFGEAAEMAKAALFLASDDSSFMTGASLVVDGGITSAYVTPE